MEQSSQTSDAAVGHQRQNGFERPYSRDQLISWLGHSCSALCFFIGAIGVWTSENNGTQEHKSTIAIMTVVAVAIHVVNSILLFISWRSCELIDPALPIEESLPNGWCGIKLKGPRWEKKRYCALCRKTVPGLDHHCTWLQTCIGKNNYAQFFTVACTGTLQFVLQVVYASMCLSWLHWEVDVFVETSFIICLVISVPCMFMYFVLLGFHLWLLVLGYGTYEWMLLRRKEQRAKVEAKKKATEREDLDESMNTQESVSSHTVVKVEEVLDERERELTVL